MLSCLAVVQGRDAKEQGGFEREQGRGMQAGGVDPIHLPQSLSHSLGMQGAGKHMSSQMLLAGTYQHSLLGAGHGLELTCSLGRATMTPSQVASASPNGAPFLGCMTSGFNCSLTSFNQDLTGLLLLQKPR